MMKKRESPAERVSDLLELLHVRRHNGLLSVERFDSGRFEEGEIYLEEGRPTYARCDGQSGKDAFSYMLGWRNVYFTFEKEGLKPITQSGSLPDLPSPALASASQSLPAVGTARASAWLPSLPLSGLEKLVPQRLQLERPVLSLPLSRSQRSIYLLIDARRTVSDLARCTGRNILEVRQLLSELQQEGLVTF
jgi:hypothetical protein